jgi:lysophospholipase L1-like esterase
MDCRIRGFGACMIGGFPYGYEDSFFYHALERLRRESTHNIIPSIFTLGGFPITRAAKYLQPKCLTAQPDLVVLQFATCDLIVPTRRKSNPQGGWVSSSQRKTSVNLPNLLDWLRWYLQGLVGDVLRLSPITPPEVYVETMNQLARMVLDHQVVPVVLSPFVFGARRADRFAREVNGQLQRLLATLPNAVYVDAYSALNRYPRWRMLLHDGWHLSLEGHRVVAETLFTGLKNIVENQAWFLKISDGQICKSNNQ